jgi:hypothetical protein
MKTSYRSSELVASRAGRREPYARRPNNIKSDEMGDKGNKRWRSCRRGALMAGYDRVNAISAAATTI